MCIPVRAPLWPGIDLLSQHSCAVPQTPEHHREVSHRQIFALQLLASYRHIPPCLSPGQQLDLLQGSLAHPTACCSPGLGSAGQDAQPLTCSSSNSSGPSPCSVPQPGSLCLCPPGPRGLLSSVPASCVPQLTGQQPESRADICCIHTHRSIGKGGQAA